MIEPVPGPSGLRSQITAIVRIDRRLKRHPSRNLDSRFGETVELGWIIRQEHDAIALEHLQHAGSNAVVALVVIETKRRVGINCIEPIVLHLIGPHLVGEAKPAALLRQIKDDAAAYYFEALKREIELIAPVAPPRAEYVAGETGGVQAHQNGYGEIGLADNDRDRTAAPRVTKNDEVGARAGIQRHRGFTGDRKRSDGFVDDT